MMITKSFHGIDEEQELEEGKKTLIPRHAPLHLHFMCLSCLSSTT